MDFRSREKTNEETGEKKSRNYLIQRISMAIQRGNAACISSTTPPRGAVTFNLYFIIIYLFIILYKHKLFVSQIL